MVTKTSVESTVPCVVTNPNISVTLHEESSGEAISGTFTPSEGFKAALEDRTYVCRGELNGEAKESQSFNVLSIAGRCWGGEGRLSSRLTRMKTVIIINPPPRVLESPGNPQAHTRTVGPSNSGPASTQTVKVNGSVFFKCHKKIPIKYPLHRPQQLAYHYSPISWPNLTLETKRGINYHTAV